ncbi:MAG: anaerobic carbon-monoxide dehydrogenase catalytic subunit [Thermodesulfobacterium sp.]|nr:anaerobic carbon-monoxide dehydrogenase catalytic subunit [Thermodesulfobacterium sp.]
MSNKNSTEELKEIFLNLKTGIKALKSGMDALEKGLSKLEKDILNINRETLEKLQKLISEKFEVLNFVEEKEENVEIKIEKIEIEPEKEETLEVSKPAEIEPVKEVKFGFHNKTLEKIYEKLHKEAPDVYTVLKRAEKTRVDEVDKGGVICRICNMGPCKVVEGLEELRGICGADASLVSARNFARLVAAGVSAQADYAKSIVETINNIVKGDLPFKFKDKRKLKMFAYTLGIDLEKTEEEILNEVIEKVNKIFSQQKVEPILTYRAPKTLIEKWRKYEIMPKGIEEEIVELIYRTSLGVDQYYKNILFASLRCALADGWVASMIATELQDILLGTPQPVRTRVNIGKEIIREDMVNVVICDKDPLVTEALIQAFKDSEIIKLAKGTGAKGVNLVGLGCAGNEILMRKGFPVAGSFAYQEAVVATGAVEAIVGELIPNVVQVVNNFHTAVITTNPISQMEGAICVEFNKKYPLKSAKEILKIAVSRYSKRDSTKIYIPDEAVEAISGFGAEALMYAMGGRFRAGLNILNENIGNGKILGIALISGCDQFETNENIQVELAKELISNNILVFATGCSAIKLGMAGLLLPEASQLAGEGLKEVLEAVGCPPVLNMGSCISNSRFFTVLTEMINTGGLGKDISELPVIICFPQWVNEKALSTIMCFVSSGLQVVFNPGDLIAENKKVKRFLFEEVEKYFGGSIRFAKTANDFSKIVIDRIKQKRKKLGIEQPKPRIFYDMAMRRTLDEKRYIPSIHKCGFFRILETRLIN